MRYLGTTAIAALVTGLAAPAALALDFGNGFSLNGEVELEYIDGSGDFNETLGYGSVDLVWQQDGGGFGAFVGLDAYAQDNDNVSSWYGALTYSGSFGKVQIGAPRNALDDYIDTPEVGGLRFLDLELGALGGSYLPFITLVSNTETPVGLRYDGVFGDAKVGVSYLTVEGTDFLDLGASYQIGNTVLRAGVEQARDTGLEATAYFLGAETTIGPVLAGVMFSDSELLGNVRATKLYATYSPIAPLDLTATYLSAGNGGSSDEFYGLNADYTFGQGVYVQGGVLGVSGSSNQIYNLSLGMKF
jgi:Gram-negative porin